MCGKEITKNGMSTREGYISHLCSAKPLATPWCMWGLIGDIITHAQFQLQVNRFRG